MPRRPGAGRGSGEPAGRQIAAGFSWYQAALLATLLWSVFLLVFVRVDRMRPEYWLIPVVFIAAELSSGSLEAVGRITMLAFPYVWILANRRSLFARRAWPIVSAGLFTVMAILLFGGYWVHDPIMANAAFATDGRMGSCCLPPPAIKGSNIWTFLDGVAESGATCIQERGEPDLPHRPEQTPRIAKKPNATHQDRR